MVVGGKYTRKNLFQSRDMSVLALCQVNRKEYFETRESFRKSIKILRKSTGIKTFKNIYDCCSGHTFNAFYALSHQYAKYATVFDRRFPRAAQELQGWYSRYLPRIQYVEENIFTHEYNLEPHSLVFSIHPCRALAFRVAEIAIQNSLPCVIVPCCPGGSQKIPWLDAYPGINHYDKHAMKVAEYLSSHGYIIKIKEINEKYTPRNKIIIGIP